MPLIIPANSTVSGGYEVSNSFRSNPGSSPRLHINALGTATDIDKWTFSCWFKRSTLSSTQNLLYAYTSGQEAAILLNSDNKLDWYNYPGGGAGQIITNRVFRDVSAFYHLVCSYDGDNSTAGNRMRIYINGVEETSFATDTNPSSGEDQLINSNVAHNIGLKFSDIIQHNFSGYLSEVCLIDGQQLDPTSFGEFDEDSGIWKPIDVSGLTFGNNGFYQTYSNSGALGEDFSGNNKDFTSTNITAVDQSTDTCTNNFATWSALTPRSSNITLSEGNLNVTMGGTQGGIFATIGVSSGKWYYETKWVSGSYFQTGVVATDTMNDNDDVYGGKTGAFMYKQNGDIRSGGNTLASVSSLSSGDIVSVALDMDNDRVYFYKNGAIQNSGTGFDISAYSEYTFGCAPTLATLSGNFGSPSFAISSGNADGNGYGNFEYAVPSGYYSLNTKNLAEYG